MDENRVKEELVDWITKPGNEELLESLQLMKEASDSGDWYDELSEKGVQSIKKGLEDHRTNRRLSSKEFWVAHII